MESNYWLVDALVERLAPVVPDGVGISASATGDDVAIAAGGYVYTPVVRTIVERGGGPASAVSCVLIELQTAIEDELEQVWPAPVDATESERAATPEAEVLGPAIEFGYFQGDFPVLSFEPIPLPAAAAD